MNKSARDAAAEEYAKKSVPFECEDSEGLYVEEVYPSQIRSVAEIGFKAGIQWAITHDPAVRGLVEALREASRDREDMHYNGGVVKTNVAILAEKALEAYEKAMGEK